MAVVPRGTLTLSTRILTVWGKHLIPANCAIASGVDRRLSHQAARKYAVKTEGSAAAANAQVLAELARLIDEGDLEVPIAHVYPLEQVQEAYRELERRHTHGKIVLVA